MENVRIYLRVAVTVALIHCGIVCNAGNDASVALGGYGAPVGITLADIRLETVSYYDTYGFIDFLKDKSVVPSADALRSSGHARATGLPTGVLTRASDGQTLCGALYYDSRGNLTREAGTGLDGRICVTTCSYDFAGRMISSVFTVGTGGDAHSVTTTNTYDPSSGKPVVVSHTVSVGGASRSTARTSLGYDGVGRVGTVSRGDKCGTVSTTRNIRGWTSGITGPGFTQELLYTENTDRQLFSSLVSQQTWRDDTGRRHTYTYSYDGLGRLTDAAYAGQPGIVYTTASGTGSLGGSAFLPKTADYSESVTEYSPNGSVLGLRRKGAVRSSDKWGLIDDLSLEYEGNRLVRATDNGPGITRYGAMDFVDGADEDVEYCYDSSGRLVADANKGISRIEYDESGYPRLVQFGGGSQTHYVYTPDGRRLRAKHLTAVAGITVPQLQKIDLGASMIQAADSTDYVGRFVYSDGRPDLCLFDGGYFKAPGAAGAGQWTACHYTCDHLGNVRAVTDSDGNILQTLHYYPFGAVISDLGKGHSEQPYQFGGKEIDRMHGLDLSDFGARLYDAALASWTSPDPLQREYPSFSPYIYCLDNPINCTDPTGTRVLFVNGHWNKYYGRIIGSEYGGKKYWSRNFVTAALSYFNDNSVNDDCFIDGSSKCGVDMGGKDRYNAGYRYAVKNIAKLTKGLKEGECFNMVTHSEGSAYGAGVAAALIDYGYTVAKILHLSADEGDEFSTPEQPYTLQIAYDEDWVTGNEKITGTDIYAIVSKGNLDWKHVHGYTKNPSVFKIARDLNNVVKVDFIGEKNGEYKSWRNHLPTKYGTEFIRINEQIFYYDDGTKKY